MTTKSSARIFLGIAAAGALTLGLAPGASAQPVGPWGVEGPCAGIAASDCVWTPSADGLTWSLYNRSAHYDKAGNFVCQTGYLVNDAAGCEGMMVAVRTLPQLPIGDWIWAVAN